MSLESLPEELFLIILRLLDFQSLYNLYDTGNRQIQTVICTPGVIKTCNLSLSSLATSLMIKTNFFKNVASNLLELDLTAIQDLTKTELLPAMKRMNKLTTLNVAFTKITIFDFIELYEHCHSIKNIAINYLFSKDLDKPELSNTIIDFNSYIDSAGFCSERLWKCQDVFARMEVAKIESSLNKKHFPEFLQWRNVPCCPPIVCNTFTIYNLNHRQKNSFSNVNKFRMLTFHYVQLIENLGTDYEYLYIYSPKLGHNRIQCSPLLGNFLSSDLSIVTAEHNLSCHLEFENYDFLLTLFSVNSVIFFWNKKTINFDDTFFQNLNTKLEPLLPHFYSTGDMIKSKSPLSNWILVENPSIKQFSSKCEKRMRVASPNTTIDLDKLLEFKCKVELNVEFTDCALCVVTLSENSEYLKKLTFLKLSGLVKYSNDFFNVLFGCCENLATINVEAPPLSPCVQSISRSVALSRSLKNLRIVDKTIDFNELFSSLGQCKLLENVIIIDMSMLNNDLGKPDTFIKQCDKLYYLCIEASMSKTTYKNRQESFNKCKVMCGRRHLVINIFISNSDYQYSYDPFVDVFRLNQIRVIR